MSFLNNSTNFSEISSGDPSINCVSFVLSGTYILLMVTLDSKASEEISLAVTSSTV